jgi:NitT/TauT family transport system substrate-binding protein
VGVGSYTWVSHNRSLPSPEPVEKITLGVLTGMLTAPIWIAGHHGYFRDAGVEVRIKEFQTGAWALEALLQGEPLDIVTVAPTPIMLQSFTRDDFRIITAFAESQDFDKVIANTARGITTVADLQGKKIGVPRGTSSHLLLEILLVEHGLAPSQVEVIDLTPVDVPYALARQHVDAIAIWEPYATHAMELLHGRAIRLSPPGTYRITFYFVAMHDFLHKRQQAVTRFLAAIERANRFLSERREDAGTILADRLRLERAGVTQILGQSTYRLWLDQLLVFDLESQARWAIKSQLTDKAVVPNYLRLVSFDGLQRVNPKAVTLIPPQN